LFTTVSCDRYITGSNVGGRERFGAGGTSFGRVMRFALLPWSVVTIIDGPASLEAGRYTAHGGVGEFFCRVSEFSR